MAFFVSLVSSSALLYCSTGEIPLRNLISLTHPFTGTLHTQREQPHSVCKVPLGETLTVVLGSLPAAQDLFFTYQAAYNIKSKIKPLLISVK